MEVLHPSLVKPGNNVDSLICQLCPQYCDIEKYQHGKCATVSNTGKELRSIISDKFAHLAIDPMEKKPLYHYYPGEMVLSVGAPNCNLKCPYCINNNISMLPYSKVRSMPTLDVDDIFDIAKRKEIKFLAFTYTEPSIWVNTLTRLAEMAHTHDMKTIMVTNGLITPERIGVFTTMIDAFNVNIKTLDNNIYRDILGGPDGGAELVIENIKKIVTSGKHIELTTTIVKTITEDWKVLNEIGSLIYDIDPSIPWHITRYKHVVSRDLRKYEFPNYDSVNTLAYNKVRNIPMRLTRDALKIHKLHHVYVEDDKSSYKSVSCPNCGIPVINRSTKPYEIRMSEDKRCMDCNHSLNVRL